MAKRDMSSLSDVALMDNGAVGRAFGVCMQEIYESLAKLPANEQARKMVLTLEFIPQCTSSGKLHNVITRAAIKVAKPARMSNEIVCSAVKDQTGVLALVYNDESPDDPDQETMHFEEKEEDGDRA